MIKFHCPLCNRTISAEDENAGNSAKCPACKKVIVVPPAPPTSVLPPDVPESMLTPGPSRQRGGSKSKKGRNWIETTVCGVAVAAVAALLIYVGAVFARSKRHAAQSDVTSKSQILKDVATASPLRPEETTDIVPVTGVKATKDQPFVNLLGMKFVPVKITGGPNAGQQVLFNVWETRVQDYRKYAEANNVVNGEWNTPGFAQGDDHPVVNVSWDDATEFCKWLTKSDRNNGEIHSTAKYRLPTDHEWSCAVGIGEREDAKATPAHKSLNISDVYPWGTQWPPPKGAGNYSRQLEVDDYDRTSPVGSFSAIHEIGHNCGLDHHGYDTGIACVMTADTDLDCLERLDQGTHRFCSACQLVVDRKLAGLRS